MSAQLAESFADRRLRSVEDLCRAREAAHLEQQGQNPKMPKADVIFVHSLTSVAPAPCARIRLHSTIECSLFRPADSVEGMPFLGSSTNDAMPSLGRQRTEVTMEDQKFIIQPHFRLQEWVAEEKGYFADEGLEYVFQEKIRSSDGKQHDRQGAQG